MKTVGYKVPEGYFDQLKGSIMESARVMQEERDTIQLKRPLFRTQMRSAAVFAASFAAMVVLAITGYYFTGYKASEKELAQSVDDMTLVYGIDELDLVELTVSAGQETLLSEASIEYFEAFGYPVTQE